MHRFIVPYAGIDHEQHLVCRAVAAVGDLDHRFPFGSDLDDRAFTRIQRDLLAVDLGRDHAHFACRQHVEPQRDFRLAVVDDLHAESGVIRQRGDVCGNILIGIALNCRIGDVDGICLRVRRHRIQAFDRAVERQLFRIEHRFNDPRLFARLFLFHDRKRHFGQGDAAAVDGGIFINGRIEHHLQALRAVRGVVHDLDGDRFAGGDLEGGAAPVAVGIHRLPVHGGGDVARLGIGRDLLVRHHVDAQSQRFAAVVGDFGGEGIVVFGDGADVGDVHVLIRCALDARIGDVHGVVFIDGDGIVVTLHGDIRAVDLNGGVGTAGRGFGLGFRLRFGHGVGRGRRGLGKRHFRDGDVAAVGGGIFIDGGIKHHLQALRAVRGVVHDLDGDRFAGGDLEGGAAPVAVGIHRLPVHGGGDVARLGIGRDLLVRHHVDAQSQRFAAVVGDFGGEGIVVFGDGADVGDVHVLIRCALDARIGDVHGVVFIDGDGIVVTLHGDIRAVDLNGGVGTAGHAGLNRALVREEHHLGQGDAAAVCIFVAAGAV